MKEHIPQSKHCTSRPLEVSHQVTEGLIVGWWELQQTLMDGLQSGFSIWKSYMTSVIRLASEHRRVPVTQQWRGITRSGGALTCSLNKFGVQFKRNDWNGKVS